MRPRGAVGLLARVLLLGVACARAAVRTPAGQVLVVEEAEVQEAVMPDRAVAGRADPAGGLAGGAPGDGYVAALAASAGGGRPRGGRRHEVVQRMIAVTFPALATTFQRARARFDRIDPPARYAPAHAALADALGRMDDALAPPPPRATGGPAGPAVLLATAAPQVAALRRARERYAAARVDGAARAGAPAPDLTCPRPR